MEFALCLRYGAPPTMPLCIHSTMSATRTTKLSFSSSHSSLLRSRFSKYRRLGHVFSPVACAVDGSSSPSTNDKDNIKRKSGTGDTKEPMETNALKLFLGVIKFLASSEDEKVPVETNALIPLLDVIKFLASSEDEKVPMETNALKSFMYVIQCLASKKQPTFKLLKSEPSQDAVEEFKIVLFRSAEANDAFTQLTKEYEYCKNRNQTQSVFYLEMALVEFYLYQGEYEKALEYNCLKDDKGPMSDRVALYKAIAYTILAKKSWEKFTETIGGPLMFKK